MARMAKDKRYVIVKRVTLRAKADHKSPEVCSIPFGRSVNILPNFQSKNGWVCVEYKTNTGKSGVTRVGWILKRAIIKHKVEDYVRLRFINRTGKVVPVTLCYGDTAPYQYLRVGEAVEMIARCGEWCLTNRGWTLYKWFEKDKDVFDQHAIDYLFYSVLELAAKDYRRAVNRLKQKNLDSESIIRSVIMIDDVASWFKSDDYKTYFDGVPGSQRLTEINSVLGITNKWLKEKRKQARLIQEKRGLI